MKTDILLTGASGFLGKEIRHTLSGAYRFFTLSRQTIDTDANHITADISQGKIKQLPATGIVVHCAGKAHSIPRSAEEEETFYQVNLQGTINLCQSLEEANAIPGSFIFISTVAVYGKEHGVLISEEAPLLGDSPYAKSKIMAETYLQEWAAAHQVKLGILRLPLIAGAQPPGNLGAMIKGIRSGRYLRIGKADAKKSIVWAGDVATIIPVVAEIGGVYNLTDGCHPSFRELEHSIAAGLGKNDPRSIPLSFAKLLALTGDILGDKFPVNSDKLKKLTTTLTFGDMKARTLLNWKPSVVTEKIRFIV